MSRVGNSLWILGGWIRLDHRNPFCPQVEHRNPEELLKHEESKDREVVATLVHGLGQIATDMKKEAEGVRMALYPADLFLPGSGLEGTDATGAVATGWRREAEKPTERSPEGKTVELARTLIISNNVDLRQMHTLMRSSFDFFSFLDELETLRPQSGAILTDALRLLSSGEKLFQSLPLLTKKHLITPIICGEALFGRAIEQHVARLGQRSSADVLLKRLMSGVKTAKRRLMRREFKSLLDSRWCLAVGGGVDETTSDVRLYEAGVYGGAGSSLQFVILDASTGKPANLDGLKSLVRSRSVSPASSSKISFARRQRSKLSSRAASKATTASTEREGGRGASHGIGLIIMGQKKPSHFHTFFASSCTHAGQSPCYAYTDTFNDKKCRRSDEKLFISDKS